MRTHTKRRITPLHVVLVALLSLLAACGSQAGATTNDEGKVEFRYQSIAGWVDTLQLADALGYLPNIELVKEGDATGGPQMLQALVSNQVDIAISPFFGATAQLVATGAPIKAVVSTYGSSGGISSSLVVPEDSTVKSAQDLVGKKIAVNTLGANAEAVLDTWFEEEGLTPEETDQITLVVLPPLNTEAALRQGQIDAAYLSSGFLAIAQKQGGLKEVFKDTDVIGDYNGGGAVLTERFLEEYPDAAKEIATGIAKAVQYIESHEREETLAVYSEWLETNGYGDYVEAVSANWAGSTGVPTPDASIRDEDISLWLDWLKSRGDVDSSSIEPSDVYTNEFNEEASS
ncbi:MAG TPA: ABC transporter substrate-binding protein [Nocardioidaceae bacterium]|nr:ABC transporter substrate-binding protein [Nocardioidaceae bacterium]